MKARDDIDIRIANRGERSRLVLAVLEIPLLVGGKRRAQGICNGLAELSRGLKREQLEAIGLVLANADCEMIELPPQQLADLHSSESPNSAQVAA